MIAPLSKTAKSPFARSIIAGMRPLGLMRRNSGVFCSPLLRLIGCTVYGMPISSSMTEAFQPLGVDAVYRSIIGVSFL